MMKSSNGNIFALLAICVGNSPVTGEFPAQRPVTPSFDVFFDLRLNKRFYAVNWCVSRWNGRDTMDVIIFFISRPGGLTREKV